MCSDHHATAVHIGTFPSPQPFDGKGPLRPWSPRTLLRTDFCQHFRLTTKACFPTCQRPTSTERGPPSAPTSPKMLLSSKLLQQSYHLSQGIMLATSTLLPGRIITSSHTQILQITSLVLIKDPAPQYWPLPRIMEFYSGGTWINLQNRFATSRSESKSIKPGDLSLVALIGIGKHILISSQFLFK